MRIGRICAWCNHILPSREYQCAPSQNCKETVNHGICADCFEKVLDEIASVQTESGPIDE